MTGDHEIIVAVLGIITMIVARLLDWYFPLGRSNDRRRNNKNMDNGNEA